MMKIAIQNVTKIYGTFAGRTLVLDCLTLTINEADKIGLLGRNGSGKSTLMKLIGGVEYPSSGRISSNMTISWPMGFSGAFQGSLTGRDNARFIARIYGKKIDEIIDFVEDFAELGSYMKMPVKTFSSGMRARLAFGLSLAIDFDCYLIDEVISVGDQKFQQKSHYELFQRKKDRTLIIASHDPNIIKAYCNKAVVLDRGKARIFDDIDEALAVYTAL